MPASRARSSTRRRPHWPGALLALTGVAILAAACAGDPSEPACGETSHEAPPAGSTASTASAADANADAVPFQITWLGDTLLGDAAQQRLEQRGQTYPFEFLRPLLGADPEADPGADYVVLNAEGPLTTRSEPYDRGQRWSYNTDPAAATALAEVGVSAAGLANNHAMDRGPEGLFDTIDHLRAAGIETFGAGPDRDAALRPLLIETPHGAVGVVGFGQAYGARKNAGERSPGSAVAEPCAIAEGAKLAREAGARWLVAFVHWGSNYADVQGSQRAQAGRFVEAGYDLVIGHGPHVQQPIELLEGVPIVYSLGNFVFGTPGRFSDEFPGFGLAVTSTLDARGFTRLSVRCIRTDNDIVGFRPRPCSESEASRVLPALHPDIRLRGDEGILELDTSTRRRERE